MIDGTTRGRPTQPPAPWANVLANPGFGCLVTEAGLGCSWAGNSQLNRLTPWNNDPVSDPPAEAVYLRDEESGEVWTPTPLPAGSGTAVHVRHGQGYTSYACNSHGLEQELLVLVPTADPVKLVRLSVRNKGDRPRQLSATFYAEWVLGTARESAPMQVVCEYDAEIGAVLARSSWAGDFAGRIAFAGVGARPHSATADRTEFLGRHGSPSAPAALTRSGLSGRAGPLLDPCAALTMPVTLAPGKAVEVVFVLGQADTMDHVRHLITTYTAPGQLQVALQAGQDLWDEILGAVQVRTPDPAMDLMLNRWLLYQVLACRVWGRTAFYQSSGAYGFRDQLQDIMALVTSAPHEARAQILRSAARQFEEGDVQHWWHPPSGRGIRTRVTDDMYFLPLAVHHYVTATGDAALLDERIPFLKSPVLRPDQEEDYGLPVVSEQTGSVYEHCVRALEHGYRLGSHGLPLMGSGDWNDGMNKVGAHGMGESVWNGWFFITVLKAFAELAAGRSAAPRTVWCRERAESLRAALEAHAWDGSWYRRAYFDDGTPLGSAQNDECQITAIPQAWAVISGAGDPARSTQAMAAVQDRLVHGDSKLIQLLDPPFDKGTLKPGYIKGYVPGIRENGGQYTHAATWVVLATALQGRGDQALQLWNLLNPIYHATTPAEVALYKVEPYVVSGDVYGAPPHTGRGGWTRCVHRLRGLATYRVRPGGYPRISHCGGHTPLRAVRPGRLARVRGHLPPSVSDISDPGREPNPLRPRGPVGHPRRAAGPWRHGAADGRREDAPRANCARSNGGHMKRTNPITTLFLDIGGVLLTNGWDHQARKRAATHFKLEWDEEEVLHHLMFDTYEEGKLTLDEYLKRKRAPWPLPGSPTNCSTRSAMEPCCRSCISMATRSATQPSWPASSMRNLSNSSEAAGGRPTSLKVMTRQECINSWQPRWKRLSRKSGESKAMPATTRTPLGRAGR